MTTENTANPAPQQSPGETVQLSKQEYAQLIGANSQMRAQMDLLVQHLEAQESQAASAPKANANANPNMPTGDVDSMSNTQLLDFIQKQMAQPILNTVMQLAVKEELRDVRNKYNDFDDHKDQVYNLASTNTSLSLEQAYLLAKSGKTPPPAPAAKTNEDVTPPAKQELPAGQKPNQTVATSSTASTGIMSSKEAAQAALKALQYE